MVSLTIGDFLRHINATGTKLLDVGHAQPTGTKVPPEFQFATSFNFKPDVPNDTLSLLDSIPLGSPVGTFFDIGLTVLTNTPAFLPPPPRIVILPSPTTNIGPPGPPYYGGTYLNDIGVVSGATSGAANATYVDLGLGVVVNPFSNSPYIDGVTDPNGLTSLANYFPAANNANLVIAAAPEIPEPASMSIFVVMAGALAYAGRRRLRDEE